jgi:hypothetical protein
METRARLLLVLAGLPEPETNINICDVNGHWLARGDLVYLAYKIVLEYDGDLHRTSKSKWRSDLAVRDRLRELGWTVIVLTADDLYLRPLQTVWRIRDALVRRGCPARPIDPGWEQHLPPRRAGSWS